MDTLKQLKMAATKSWLLLVGTLCFTLICAEKVKDKEIAFAVVESCSSSCSYKVPEVQKFILEDLPLFHDVSFETMEGWDPQLILKNKKGAYLKVIDLVKMSRQECNDLLLSYGFYKKLIAEAAVPEAARGPYRLKEEL